MEDNIREILEGLNIPSEKIDELIAVMKEREEHPLADGDKVGDAIFHTLKEELEKETNWRKRASIAARLVSLGLE